MSQEVRSHLGRSDAALIGDLYPGLRSFASVVALPGEDPNDLVQEALVRTLRHGSLGRLDHPKAYLRTVIYHVAVSTRRRWTAERSAVMQTVPAPVQPEDPWQVEELLRLSPKARAVMYLHVIEGLTYEEVGEQLGCSAVAARKTASRATRRLRLMLGGEVDDATAR